MYHEVRWNSELLENFIKLGNLSAEDIMLLTMRINNETKYNIAKTLNISEATYHRRVQKLKHKYDIMVKHYPMLFAPREFSRDYTLVYKNITGTATVTNRDTAICVGFNCSFRSLEDARQYFVKQVEAITGKEFGGMDTLHVQFNNISFDLDISPK